MKIITIIVTYNAMRNNWIAKCLNSLNESTCKVSVVVVDNHSSDDTVEFIRTNYPEVILFSQEKNLGFGQANNIGLRYALENNADYVLLLNQDAKLKKDALELMLAESDGESLITPTHLNGDGSDMDKNLLIFLRKHEKRFIHDILVKGRLEKHYEINTFINAACWLMPCKLIKKVGGFNPLFFHYGEDKNYINRIFYYEIKIIFVPNAYMYHDRKMIGSVKMFNNNLTRRKCLIRACNVNRGFLRVAGGMLCILRDSYRNDLWLKRYFPGEFFLACFWLLLHAPSIIKSRSIEKKEGAWL